MIKQSEYLQEIKPVKTGRGLDVTTVFRTFQWAGVGRYVDITEDLRIYRNVNTNVVRCMLGSDYDCYLTRTMKRDGQERHELRDIDIKDLRCCKV